MLLVCTRRLSTLLALTVTLICCLPAALAETRKTSIPLPIAPFAMDNGVGRGSWTPAQQAATLAELGYDGISYNYTNAADIPVWRAELAKHKLAFRGIYFGLKLDGDPLPTDFAAALEHLRGSGAVLWTTIPAPTAKNTPAAELAATAVARLRELADLAAKHDLRVVLYPHKGFYLATADQAYELVQQASRKNVSLTVNVCHELGAGNGPRLSQIVRRVAPALTFVTINGATDRPGPGWENYIKLLGEGDYDIAGLLRTLVSVSYTGPIGVQFYQVKGDTRANLATTIRVWQTLSRQATTP